MKAKILSTLVASGVWSLIFGGVVSAAPVTGFNPGRIIDDAVFQNRSSMSISQIQRFLNAKVPSCDTYGTKPSEYGGGTRAQYAASKGVKPPFTCLKDYKQNGKSAAQIIYEAAQNYRINPQVLIALLQKEQGLVTDDWPWPFQYKSATGYGCPDSAACNTAYYGFTNQVRWAAKMFHAIVTDSPTWYSPYVLGSNQIYWHPDTGRCGASTVTIQNLATVALYSYTPYRPNQAALNAGWGTGDSCSSYGNRNFYLYFTNWFGSARTSIPYSWDLVSSKAYYDAGMTDEVPGDILNMTPGMKLYFRVQARNMGYQTWDQSFMKIGTYAPQDHNSAFIDDSWPSAIRAAQMEEASVPTGSVGTFTFSMTAPNTPNEYIERFNLVAEGRTWLNNQSLNYAINVATATTPESTNSVLSSGEQIRVNEHLLSSSLHDVLTLQGDGNLVLYNNFGAGWYSATASRSVDRLIMQSDGNLVLYNASNGVVWHSRTSGNPGARLVLQNDSNMVLYSASNAVLWHTNTVWKPNGLSYVNQKMPTATLYKGQRLETPNRRYKLVLQGDGNLVLYSPNRAVWASGTVGKSVGRMTLQRDGNMVLYNTAGRMVWHTRTPGAGNPRLVMQSDGNLVLYGPSNQVLWHTSTNGKL